METREPVRVLDTAADPRYISMHPSIRSELAVPLGGRAFHQLADFLEAVDVVTVASPATAIARLGDARESKKMEEESVMVIGRKTYKMVMHFPSSSSDARMRLVFPRVVQPTDREFIIELYLPLISAPYREVSYTVKDLFSNGKLEY